MNGVVAIVISSVQTEPGWQLAVGKTLQFSGCMGRAKLILRCALIRAAIGI
jgi:hypothetical protein